METGCEAACATEGADKFDPTTGGSSPCRTNCFA